MHYDPYRTAAFAPDVTLGRSGDVEIVLEAVVLRGSGVLVALGVRPDDSWAHQQAEWQAAFETWTAQARRARDEGASTPAQPQRPWVQLSEVPLVITDDAGTAYSRAVITSDKAPGGRWEAIWRFHPATPAHARRLTVRIDKEPDRHHAHTLLL
ncbi:MAG TPA: hypothetical protein VG455_01985 [Acidimicrobiales bacterium]|nr:hypothetical protein [Acidimicrobiales bacterium]